MKIIRAKVLGFCMGVRRAVEMTEKALSAVSAEKALPGFIYTLGPLIHNPQVLASLADRGVKVLEETELFEDTGCSLSGATVIIRAHGVSPAVEQKLHELGQRNVRIIDATCPRVKANQLEAQALAEKGYRIFLAGEKDHAEIKGIFGYVMEKTSCIIVGNPEEAEQAARRIKTAQREREASGRQESIAEKTALIGQTTISEDEYRSIALAIQKYFPGLEVKNTICGATRDRQNALQELCSKADAVIIAGGKESANTRRLLTIARDCGITAWLAETAQDIVQICKDFSQINPDFPQAPKSIKTIGLSAGASTPDSVIDEIEQALVYFSKEGNGKP